MATVNMLDAKTNLSKLVQAVEEESRRKSSLPVADIRRRA